MSELESTVQKLQEQGMDLTELETFVMQRATVTIALIRGKTVITVESRDPCEDGVYETKSIVVLGDCHVNDCRQDAAE